MQYLLDLGFWHSMEEVWTRLFPTQSRFICISEKDFKKSHILTEEVWTNMFGFGLHFSSIYSFWSGQFEVQIKAHARVAPFWFSRIIAYQISIDLVVL